MFNADKFWNKFEFYAEQNKAIPVFNKKKIFVVSF